MLKRTYSVVLQTSIGNRPGTMEVQIDENRVTGRLNALKRSEPFEGSIDEAGNCRISGSLVTLVSTYLYTADGQMNADSLKLLLKSEKVSFPIVGTILQLGDEYKKEC